MQWLGLFRGSDYGSSLISIFSLFFGTVLNGSFRVRQYSQLANHICKLGMTEFTLRALRTEPGHIEGTQYLPYMSSGTLGTFRAKSLHVIGTLRNLQLRVNVKIEAFRSLGAETILGVEQAFRHLSQVIFVQEFTVVVLLAEAS